MYIAIRMMSTSEEVRFDVSRTLTIDDLKSKIKDKLKIEPEQQRLFFNGKQLENGYTLFQYKVNHNSVIQLMARQQIPIGPSEIEKKSLHKRKNNKLQEEPTCSSACCSSSNESPGDKSEKSDYFQVGDYVDVKNDEYGSWFIAKIVNIKKNSLFVKHDSNNPETDDGLIYVVEYYRASPAEPAEVQLQSLRPHSSEIISINKIKPGDIVLSNFNIDYPRERGYWYDVIIKNIKTNKKGSEVIGDVTVGPETVILENKKLQFLDDIYKITPRKLLANRSPSEQRELNVEPEMRAEPLFCINCKDQIEKRCKECGCHICGGKEHEETQLMCDECDHPFHMLCLKPPLKVMPPSGIEWYCPTCKNDENEIINAGDKLKTTKESKPTARDWGRGMACVGRSKICTIVPPNHFGPIPGIEVGTTWKYRLQVSEVGVHRPPVGGIHGRADQGAFSIVLSGGYEDDVDNGEEFLYSGSGGRDLSNNRRTAHQSSDQKLERFNMALALNCNAPFDHNNGATSKDWRKGKPVRVVRNFKLAKHSKYAPECGNRYDGIYKVVRYYPEKGISGFTVWRYVLRRDDLTPAPWTAEGKERIDRLNLKMILPENSTTESEESESISGVTKRTLQDNNDPQIGNNKKKAKFRYNLESDLENLITADSLNKKYWDDCKSYLGKTKKEFLERVQVTFLCICCQEIVSDPITTDCTHNMCKNCLMRSFNAKVFQCPVCRGELDKNCHKKINQNLRKILSFLFPACNSKSN